MVGACDLWVCQFEVEGLGNPSMRGQERGSFTMKIPSLFSSPSTSLKK